MVFLPSAIFANNQKLNEHMLSYDIYFFETEDEDFLELAKFDGHRLGRQVHFLNYVNPFVVKD